MFWRGDRTKKQGLCSVRGTYPQYWMGFGVYFCQLHWCVFMHKAHRFISLSVSEDNNRILILILIHWHLFGILNLNQCGCLCHIIGVNHCDSSSSVKWACLFLRNLESLLGLPQTTRILLLRVWTSCFFGGNKIFWRSQAQRFILGLPTEHPNVWCSLSSGVTVSLLEPVASILS